MHFATFLVSNLRWDWHGEAFLEVPHGYFPLAGPFIMKKVKGR